jgi:S1-C subfamily serine protease
LHRPSRLRTVLATTAGSLLAVLLPLAAVAADRGAEGSVVVLATQGPVHGIGVGTIVAKSGTHVRLLTAAHVATHGTLQLRLADGSEVSAHLIATVPGQDLALIEADVTEASAAVLRPAPIARPQSAEPVHVWGSGNDGPAYETATVSNVGSDLPDGAPHGRYALGCALCHQGDSGAGIFNARGELVGVYIGYFDVKSGRVSVAELPSDDVAVAARRPLGGASDAAPAGASLVAAAGVVGAR